MVTTSILLLPSFSVAQKNTFQKQIVWNKTLSTDSSILAQKEISLVKTIFI